MREKLGIEKQSLLSKLTVWYSGLQSEWVSGWVGEWVNEQVVNE